MSSSYRDRLNRVIPGGAHTYSRGHDQFPDNAPQALKSGQGVYVLDPQDNSYLDFGMGLRSVAIGYAEPSINAAAIRAIEAGNNLTRPSLVELEAAERFVDLIPAAEMVKFAKNGSNAVTAAVKLARAYTGRNLVLCCKDHPFFSFDDWFIGTTVMSRGVAKEASESTMTFPYNDIESLEKILVDVGNQVACIVLEPATTEHPATSKLVKGGNFLNDVQELCHQYGIVLIMDEMITGFRWGLSGASDYYGVKPDLLTFGKAMANGFSLAAVAGHRDIMSLGGIDKPGEERVFLLSSTHGAEMSSLAAFIQTTALMEELQVTNHLWNTGRKVKEILSAKAKSAGVDTWFQAGGVDCSPYYRFEDCGEISASELRTLFMQEMLNQGVLLPWLAIAYRHDSTSLNKLEAASAEAFGVISQAVEVQDISNFIGSSVIKPVFRKYN